MCFFRISVVPESQASLAGLEMHFSGLLKTPPLTARIPLALPLAQIARVNFRTFEKPSAASGLTFRK